MSAAIGASIMDPHIQTVQANDVEITGTAY
jgi:hypothetical protein